MTAIVARKMRLGDLGELVQLSPEESCAAEAAMAKFQAEEEALRRRLGDAGFELVEQLVSAFEKAKPPAINNFYVLKTNGVLYVVKVNYTPTMTYSDQIIVIGRITEQSLQNYLEGSPPRIMGKVCRPGDGPRNDGVQPVGDELRATLEKQLSAPFTN